MHHSWHGRSPGRGRAAHIAGALGLLLAGATLPVIAAPGEAAAAPVTCSSAVADQELAQKVAASCKTKVEIMAARTQTGQAFANPDGSTTLETSVSPRWVKRGDGSWADVDTTLVRSADGTLAPSASPSGVRFSAGGVGPVVTMVQGGKRLDLGWPGKLPAPVVDGATATYPEVLPGVDLAMTATVTGFQHVLVVKDAKAAANPALRRIRFTVGGDVTAKATPDGHVRFADRSDRTLALTSAASTWDSSIDFASAGEVLPGVSESQLKAARANPAKGLVSNASRPGVSAVSKPLGVGVAGSDLELVPDPSALSDPKTVYPLFIDPAISPGSTNWAYANSIDSNWDIGGMAWVGRNSFDGSLYRSYFDFPTESGGLTWRGKHILGASVNLWLDHSYSCTDTPTYLYRLNGAITVGMAGRMPWSTRPLGSSANYLTSAGSHANEAGGCGANQPDMFVSFVGGNLPGDVQAVANAGWTVYPVGLCACTNTNAGESTQDRWKKFFTNTTNDGHGAPSLSVTYNTVPGTPANLHPHSGVACGGYVGTTSPSIEAQYVDADGSDTLNATFEWKQLPSGAVTQVAGPAKPANNVGSVQLNLGAAAEGKSYSFRVQTNDGNDASPWSGWCDFTVDATAPTTPVVTSAAYPACNPAGIGTCTAPGGPGVSGQFTFSEPAGDPNGSDVISYNWGWTSPPTNTVTVAAGAASPAMTLTPPRFGLNTLYVSSKDPGGHTSPIKAYTFLVGSPSAAVANYPLDDIRTHGLTDLVSNVALTGTNVTWAANSRIMGATTASFGAGSDAKTAGTLLDTSKSFSVSAWVKIVDVTANNRAIVSQEGTNTSGFVLYNSADTTSFVFTMYDSDSTTAASTSVSAPATVDVWTHLTAVYDAGEKTMKLYKDGVLAQTASRTATPWNATGKFHVGWAKVAGAAMPLGISRAGDVRAWSRAVTTDDLLGTNADATNGVPAMPGVLAATEVGNWDFSGGVDCYCDNVLDGAYFGRPATLDPGWANASPTTQFTAAGHDGNDALQVNGALGQGGYAKVNTPVLVTDESLTVSAWVKLASLPTNEGVVIQQGESIGSIIKLNYTGGTTPRWNFSVNTTNGTGGLAWTTAVSNAAPTAGTWVHLVGVFDRPAGKVTLYVNGVAQTTVGNGAKGLDSTGPLMLGGLMGGTGSTLNGVIDQVKVYQGALSAREVMALYQQG
ncbi:LamG domain-containing protein [Dactylosporangium salmoneum]|uniref:LamG domain-containing protein n=1 Tax=Dactylosporangium salmoneum TaxID=53361 RepID=A0ABP5V403_9ACTN